MNDLPKYTWLLRGYEREKEELMLEIPLFGVDIKLLQNLFNEPSDNPMYDCYLVKAEEAQKLLEFVHQKVDFIEYDFFVEYI